MKLYTLLTYILYISLSHTAYGKKLSLTFTGEVILYVPSATLPAAKTGLLEAKVVSKVSANINVEEKCVQVDSLVHRVSQENASYENVNYTITIGEPDCIASVDLLTVSGVQELGITGFMLQPAVSEEAEFWQDKMNSILVFSGCGAVLLIMLVTCLVMTTGCYKKNNKKMKRRTYAPSKPNKYQPYAIDTMTLDHRKYSRKENFHSIKEGPQCEPTTIERWVNSQLSKGRRQSSAIDLNQDGRRSSDMKASDSHPDMSTTDSGIVTTAPRRTEAQLNYVAESNQPAATQGIFRHQISDDSCYHEPHHEMCNSIDYIRHSNEAYANAPLNDDSDSLEESSKL